MKHFKISSVYSIQDENMCETPVIWSSPITVFVSQKRLTDITRKLEEFILTLVGFLQISADVNEGKFCPSGWVWPSISN